MTALAKHVRLELLPVQDDDDEDRAKRANDSLPPSVVEAAISSIMERNNYGLEAPALAKLPAALAAWRWEVRDEFKDWLPKSARDKAEARLEERKQVRPLSLSAKLCPNILAGETSTAHHLPGSASIRTGRLV